MTIDVTTNATLPFTNYTDEELAAVRANVAGATDAWLNNYMASALGNVFTAYPNDLVPVDGVLSSVPVLTATILVDTLHTHLCPDAKHVLFDDLQFDTIIQEISDRTTRSEVSSFDIED